MDRNSFGLPGFQLFAILARSRSPAFISLLFFSSHSLRVQVRRWVMLCSVRRSHRISAMEWLSLASINCLPSSKMGERLPGVVMVCPGSMTQA